MMISEVPVSPEAYRLFHEASIVFAQVEHNGCRVDTAYLARESQIVDGEIREIEQELRHYAEYQAMQRLFGAEANLDSNTQLCRVLYKEMGHVVELADGTRLDNVDEFALTRIGTPFTKTLLRARKLKKLVQTYLRPLLAMQVGGYIHGSLNLNTVVSYRGSMEDPNLQNVPSRDKEIARRIRQAFIASDGCVVMELDLKGAEVVNSVCYHHDPVMMAYLKNPASDMHRDVAKRCFFLTEVPKAVRQATKGDFTFSAFYGDWWRSNAQKLWDDIDLDHLKTPEGVPLYEHLAANGIHGLGSCRGRNTTPGTFEHHVKIVDDWFWNEQFKVYSQWKVDWWNAYLERGAFTTLTGFRLQGVFTRNQVLNYPIQGSSFHCLLWALIELQKWLARTGKKTRIINTIHDSIILDVKVEELHEVAAAAEYILTVLLPQHWRWLCVPVTAEIEVAPRGGSWFDKVPLSDLVL